ncbi:MAG: hypothetical protein PHE25_03040 [Candidatus Gracilibacteria bacterium]|nr:hypothetical protein [Candidatus Gracilibacteria bacterium]
MATILSKKDFKIIGINAKNPEKIIIELDQRTLDGLVGTKKRKVKNSSNMTLKEYIKSGEINNPKNISGVYDNMEDLILSLK